MKFTTMMLIAAAASNSKAHTSSKVEVAEGRCNTTYTEVNGKVEESETYFIATDITPNQCKQLQEAFQKIKSK